jgi:hypothetical protein
LDGPFDEIKLTRIKPDASALWALVRDDALHDLLQHDATIIGAGLSVLLAGQDLCLALRTDGNAILFGPGPSPTPMALLAK